MIQFTNLRFNSSGSIVMNKKKYVFIVLLFALSACGTRIGNGNPSPSPIITPLEFWIPINKYLQSTFTDCGMFNEYSSQTSIDAGRQCIRNALDTCTPSKYLYDKKTRMVHDSHHLLALRLFQRINARYAFILFRM
jgi:hypothetical protein